MNTEQSHEDYRKQYIKEYQKRNSEQTKIAKAKWRDKNRQHTRNYAKDYYAKNKKKYAGSTNHYVNAKLDTGKIISQKKIRIVKNDTPISLAKKILDQEHQLYPKAILKNFNL